MNGNRDRIKEIAKNSIFTIGFNEDNFGYMNIPAVSIQAIIPERGYYQSLYNNPKNNLTTLELMLRKLEKIGVYKESLYGKDNGVFKKHLTKKGFDNCLKEYNEIKRIHENKSVKVPFIMPKKVKETGLTALKAFISSSNQNNQNNLNR